ncbi:MAG: DUF4912 domain-containing protein [Deltaproteobacteria bacterium]|nr:DUF4912 domain-containing protein [Deltaproteobacteria bacterium]
MAGFHERFLARLPLSVLRAVARRMGVEGGDDLDREALIERLTATPMQRAASLGQSLRRLVGRLPGGVLRTAAPPPPAQIAARRDGRPPEPAPSDVGGPPAGSGDSLRFETMSMVELLLRQGHVDEARATLRRIVERDPGNRAAHRRLDELQGGLPRPATLVTHEVPGPPRTTGVGGARAPRVDEPVFRPFAERPVGSLGMPDLEQPPLGYGRIYAGLLHVEPTTLYAYWEVTPDAVDAVRRRLADPDARLTLRLVSHYVEARAGGTVHDVEVEDLAGEYFFVGLQPGGQHRLAVGLRSKADLFEPICHTGLAATSPAAPSADTRETWLEVEPPGRQVKPVPQPIRIVGRTTGSPGEALRTRARRLGLGSLPEKAQQRILERLHELLEVLGRPGALPTSPGLTQPGALPTSPGLTQPGALPTSPGRA